MGIVSFYCFLVLLKLTCIREFSDRFPNTDVVGTNLAAIQPELIPEKLQILINNANDPWEYTEAFDFIHCRGLDGGIRNWSIIFTEMYRALTPGRYAEVSNISLHVGFVGNIRTKLPQILCDLEEKTGYTFDITKGDRCSQLMENTRFKIVYNKRLTLQVTATTKIGTSLLFIITKRLKEFYIRLLDIEDVPAKKAKELVRQFTEDLLNEREFLVDM